ncbi:MAG: Gfo/Idh/MocA family oxidoreductase [bacterium]|nr:Gfo/Idh/MocA family oxidoreductase [bacterium]
MNKRILGLIGAGYWGENILRNLYELGALHTVCDIKNEIIEASKGRFSDLNYVNSVKEVLNNPEIKAVVIATPPITHYKIAKDALISGKDVFVEKPLSLTVSEGEELVDLSEKNNKILMVGHILQYHSAIIKLKEMIDSGELGKVEYIYSNRLNIGRLRTEENILWSFAPHDFSVILMLIGNEPIYIATFGGDYLNNGIYDTTLTTFEFKNGVKGHVFVSWLHPFKEQKLIVVGSKAMAVFNDLAEEKLVIYSHKIQWEKGKLPIAEKAECYPVEIKYKKPLREELKHFIECVIERKRPKTDGKEGLEVLRMLEFAEKSLRNGGIPVNLQTSHYFIHESSYIDEDVMIGEGTKIWHFSHILKETKIGKNCIIGQNVMIGPNVTIGDRCKIQNNVSIYKGVVLEDDVFCGPSCVFTNVYNPRSFIEKKDEFMQTSVKKGATIGANATIVCGVTIGRYAIVGAGAVVKRDVIDYSIVVGVPAKHIGWACKCGNTLCFEENFAICKYCRSEYLIENKKIKPIKG